MPQLLKSYCYADDVKQYILSIERFIHMKKITVNTEDVEINQQIQDLQEAQSNTSESQNSRHTELQNEARNTIIGIFEESESDANVDCETLLSSRSGVNL